MLNPGTYLQERYEILEKIGSGGMSVVYKAKCHTLNRLVAIKVLKEEFASDENFVSKFKMEAQAAARLSHPNIVNVYDVVDEENLHYIVMELIEGITLKSYIEKKELLDSKEAIGIAIQVAQGIAAAHEQHIIHRDIKPQNMIISKDGKVKVADFGIARAVSSQTLLWARCTIFHRNRPEADTVMSEAISIPLELRFMKWLQAGFPLRGTIRLLWLWPIWRIRWSRQEIIILRSIRGWRILF